ncbi:hypothetical protein NFI96_031826 [Prochilodus magdalenae]|nr:hypothetical protein NFI96_031826 [Prochilodus magdalenae]
MVLRLSTLHFLHHSNNNSIGAPAAVQFPLGLTEGGVTRPSLSLLPPSSLEPQQGKATLLCLVSKAFPSDWTVSWKVDGSRWSSGVVVSPAVLYSGLYSWSSTLTLTEDQWRKIRVVSCEVNYGSNQAVMKSLNTQQCTEN